MTYYPGHAAGETEPAARSPLWRRRRPGAGDPHTSLLFWLTVLGLACVSLLSVGWGASSILAQKGSEKHLRAELLFPKLNHIRGDGKADAFRMSDQETSELPPPKERKIPAAAPALPTVHDQPRMTTVEPPRHGEEIPASLQGWERLVAPVEPTPVETCDEPLIYQQRCTSQPGESPMIRNWKTLTMISLLSTAAITFAPQPAVVFAQDKNKKDAQVEVKGLDELKASVNKLIDRIDKLEKKKTPSIDQEELTKVILDLIRAELKKTQEAINKSAETAKAERAALQQTQLTQRRELDKLNEDLSGLSKKLNAAAATPAIDKAFMEEFRSDIKGLKESVARLGPTREHISGASPISNGSAAKGHLVIVNFYNEDLLFLVNDAPYRVPAGMSKALEVPAGPLHYLVHSSRWGTLSNQTTTLAAGDTFTLTAK